jgi:hypothetical protein
VQRPSFDVRTSKDASLFHAVDQMSRWSQYCHPQYMRWAPNDDDARAALARHASMRRRTGWGAGGFERAFYIGEAKALDPDDARAEEDVFAIMRPRLAARLEGGDAQTKKLEAALARERPVFDRMLNAWATIVGKTPDTPIPVVFVPSPGRGVGGGGANGGVVVIEVPEEGDADGTLSTVLHELVHAVVAPRKDEIAEHARACGHGLDVTSEGEALAYAIAPGLFAHGDALGALERQRDRNAASTPYGRFARLAIAIRPLMQQMLERPQHDSLRALLDATCAAAADVQAREP